MQHQFKFQLRMNWVNNVMQNKFAILYAIGYSPYIFVGIIWTTIEIKKFVTEPSIHLYNG